MKIKSANLVRFSFWNGFFMCIVLMQMHKQFIGVDNYITQTLVEWHDISWYWMLLAAVVALGLHIINVNKASFIDKTKMR